MPIFSWSCQNCCEKISNLSGFLPFFLRLQLSSVFLTILDFQVFQSTWTFTGLNSRRLSWRIAYNFGVIRFSSRMWPVYTFPYFFEVLAFGAIDARMDCHCEEMVVSAGAQNLSCFSVQPYRTLVHLPCMIFY